MKKIIFILAVIISTVYIASCKKNKGCKDPISINYDSDADEDDGSCKYGGTGGNVSLVVKPQHHGDPILNSANYPDTAYIKFNHQEFPGENASDYDLVVAGIHIGEDHVEIENLKPGKYFIFATGFDSSINARVLGGIPYTITAESGEVIVNVPVVE